MSFEAALAEAARLSNRYSDVHYWVFTSDSFLRTFDALRSADHIRWELEAFEEVQPGQNEVRALLRRS